MVNKKAAIELSIGTIVIIVLAMSMLILGLVLIKGIFSGATYNVDSMNNKVRDEINKLFVEDKKTVVYLPNQLAQIKQNSGWGIAFAIKNLNKGAAEGTKFYYEVVLNDEDVRSKCGIGVNEVSNWIKTGRSETVDVAPGDTIYRTVRLQVPDGAPLCTVHFNIKVTDKTNNKPYFTDFFDVEVLTK